MYVHSLDEQMATSSAIRKRLILALDITMRMFLLASPHLLAHRALLISALFKVAMKNHMVRSISIVEAHLFSQHGGSFQSEIGMIGR